MTFSFCTVNYNLLVFVYYTGGIYGVCIYAHPGAGKLFLDLKLGDIVEIEKKNFGKNSHMAIKNGVKGLVGTSFLQLLTYEQLIAGNFVILNY